MDIVRKIENILGESKTDSYKHLGYANAWHAPINEPVPEIYKKCKAKNHKLSHHYVGRDSEYYCDICKFKFNVDSSD